MAAAVGSLGLAARAGGAGAAGAAAPALPEQLAGADFGERTADADLMNRMASLDLEQLLARVPGASEPRQLDECKSCSSRRAAEQASEPRQLDEGRAQAPEQGEEEEEEEEELGRGRGKGPLGVSLPRHRGAAGALGSSPLGPRGGGMTTRGGGDRGEGAASSSGLPSRRGAAQQRSAARAISPKSASDLTPSAVNSDDDQQDEDVDEAALEAEDAAAERAAHHPTARKPKDAPLRRSGRPKKGGGSPGGDPVPPKEKRRVGRPIAYTGDPNAPELTQQERRRIKRRIANRESARRVRSRRQGLLEEMIEKAAAMEENVAKMAERLADSEAERSALGEQGAALYARYAATADENRQLRAELAELRASLGLDKAFEEGMGPAGGGELALPASSAPLGAPYGAASGPTSASAGGTYPPTSHAPANTGRGGTGRSGVPWGEPLGVAAPQLPPATSAAIAHAAGGSVKPSCFANYPALPGSPAPNSGSDSLRATSSRFPSGRCASGFLPDLLGPPGAELMELSPSLVLGNSVLLPPINSLGDLSAGLPSSSSQDQPQQPPPQQQLQQQAQQQGPLARYPAGGPRGGAHP